ncbi:hypothetical protein [Streptomyces malaysiensis]|uniref:hypothetical protein n=1 Tax=Streptomyces malaysiensis TaxID=92644 RepID=UPI0037229E47
MLLRLAYLAATNALAFLRLLPMSNRDKDIEILVLRHQLLVLQRQVGKPAFNDSDRAVLAGLLHHLPKDRLRHLLLLVLPLPEISSALVEAGASGSRNLTAVAQTGALAQLPSARHDDRSCCCDWLT